MGLSMEIILVERVTTYEIVSPSLMVEYFMYSKTNLPPSPCKAGTVAILFLHKADIATVSYIHGSYQQMIMNNKHTHSLLTHEQM